MMKATPVAPLVVAQSQLGFELLIIPLDPPAPLGVTHQLFEGELLRQGGQPIMRGLSFSLGPFDQQPLLSARLVGMSRSHAYAGKARSQRAVRAFAPAHLAPTFLRQSAG